MPPVLVTPPAAAISLAEAKAHLRVDHGDDDALIEGLIGAAVSYLDGYTGILGRALEAQTWELTLDRFPAAPFALPVMPAASITSIKYDDSNGDEQTVEAESYRLVSGRIILESSSLWPIPAAAAGSVRIRWVAGTGTPLAVKHAMLLLIGHWYANREAVAAAVSEMPLGVSALLAPWRRVGI